MNTPNAPQKPTTSSSPTLTANEYARLYSLQPPLQQLYLKFREAAWRTLDQHIYLASATRTFDEQARLYEQGRTRSGPIVTRARPGQSWHNFGAAFDIALMIGPSLTWNIPTEIAMLGQQLGLEWGGTWTHPDENHFQKIDGLTLGTAQSKWPRGWVSRTM